MCRGGQPGSRAGWGWGSRRRDLPGRAAAGWGEGLALNRGPQLGFHNDTSGEQAESSAVQMGKLRRRLLQSLRREGPPISRPGPFIFPRKPLRPRSWSALAAELRVYETGMEGSRSPGCGGCFTSDTPERHLPHLSCRRECSARAPVCPSPLTCLGKAHF